MKDELPVAVERSAWSAAVALEVIAIVPELVTGEPVIVNPVLVALKPTDVTVPEPPLPLVPQENVWVAVS